MFPPTAASEPLSEVGRTRLRAIRGSWLCSSQAGSGVGKSRSVPARHLRGFSLNRSEIACSATPGRSCGPRWANFHRSGYLRAFVLTLHRELQRAIGYRSESSLTGLGPGNPRSLTFLATSIALPGAAILIFRSNALIPAYSLFVTMFTGSCLEYLHFASSQEKKK